jgi:PPOX class probable F420-dependent enzyme
MADTSILSPEQRAFVGSARVAILATISPSGHPRMVPICFVLDGDTLVSPLDQKPKRVTDPHDLARARDIGESGRAMLLVHRWDEDWSRLGWLRLSGDARVLEPGAPLHAAAVDPLREKYPQYATHAIDGRPMIAVAIDRVSSWGNLEP